MILSGFSKPKLLLLCAVTFLLTACAATTPAAPQSTQPGRPAVLLSDCQLTSPGTSISVDARCGSLEVYEDTIGQTGRKINLNFAVIPAVSKNPKPDPLFLVAGGPGQSATETFPLLLSAFERTHQDRDVVMLDQRGTGKSNPLRCPQINNDSPSADQRAKFLKDCLAALKSDTRLYTTSASISDLDQVRQALGYKQINLLGVSYGTRLSLAYLRQYPERVRTLILDSVNPLDWNLGPQNAANGQRALDMIFARCSADPACKQAFPNVNEEFKTLIAQLDRQPVEVSVTHPVTGELTQVKLTHAALAQTIQLLSYTSESAALIPLLIHTTAQRGDYSLLAAQYLIATDGLVKTLYDGLYLSVLCAEDAAFYPTDSSKANPDDYLPDPTQMMSEQCKQWPSAQVPAEFKQPVKSNAPVLLLSGEVDPVTPPANASQAAMTLPNSLNLVIPGMGHNVVYRGCIPKLVNNFLESGDVKTLDATCIQNIQPDPFFINPSGPKQ